VSKNVLVLGTGNLLLKDEGAGIHVVRKLEEEQFTEADLADGGTGGLHLLGLIQSYDVVIFVDASLDAFPAGTIRILKPRYASDFPVQMSAHEIGLKDLIESACLIGPVPEFYLVAISVKDFQDLGMELSPEVEAAIPAAAKKVGDLVRQVRS
jgi:hydrogenase maturation protease